jgi:hypothetical protein
VLENDPTRRRWGYPPFVSALVSRFDFRLISGYIHPFLSCRIDARIPALVLTLVDPWIGSCVDPRVDPRILYRILPHILPHFSHLVLPRISCHIYRYIFPCIFRRFA